MSRESIGEFEQLILLAILRLEERAYGVTILDEVRSCTGRSVLRPAVYVALRRLEGKGLVRSREEAGDSRRGGRPRRYYAVEPSGLSQLRDARQALLSMWEGLQGVLGG